MLATTLSLGKDNELTTAGDNVKYYENVHWSQVADLPDCDATCVKGIDEIRSKLLPLRELPLGSCKCKFTLSYCSFMELISVISCNQVAYFCCTATSYPVLDYRNAALEHAPATLHIIDMLMENGMCIS